MTRTTTLLFVLGFFLWGGAPLQAQLTFQRALGTPGNDRDYSIDKTPDGGYITAGYTEHFSGTLDIYVIKTDAWGNEEWSRTLSNANNQRAWQIRTDSRGGYVMVGASTDGNNPDKAFMIRLNSLGNVDWQLFIEGPEDLVLYGLTETSTGNYVASGLRRTQPSERDLFVAKVSATGNLMFSNSYEYAGNQQSFNITEDANGHFIATGWFSNAQTSNVNRVVLCKIDSSGNHLNTLTTALGSSSAPEQVRGYTLLQSGSHYYVGGWADRVIMQKVDTTFLSASITGIFPNGNTLYRIPSANNCFDIKEARDNTIMLAGYTQYNSSSERDAWLMKITKFGQGIWARNYGGAQVDGHWPTEIVVEPDRTFTFLSSTNTFGNQGSYDFYLVKTDADGRTSCNWSNANASVQTPSIHHDFFTPTTSAIGTVSSMQVQDTLRSAQVNKLCCNLRAQAIGNMNVCAGATVALGADSMQGYFYEWSSQGTVFSSRANPTFHVPLQGFSSQTFKLKVYTPDPNCAPDSVSFTLTLNPKPQANFSSHDTLCSGDSLFLSAPMGANSHSWLLGDGSVVDGISFLYAREPGLYVVSYRSGLCNYADSIQLTVNPVPQFSISDTGFCMGSFIEVVAPPGFALYQWNQDVPSTQNSRVFQNDGPQSLTITHPLGCNATDSFTLTRFSVPPAFALSTPDSLCSNQTVSVQAPFYPNHSYHWSPVNSQAQSIVAEPGITYHLAITNINGCSRADSFFITPTAAPNPLADTSLLLCPNTSFVLNPEDQIIYEWDSIPGTNQYEFDGTDISLTLVRSFANGCSETSRVELGALPVPDLDLGPDTFVMDGDTLFLFGPPDMQSYLWSTGHTTPVLAVTERGMYALAVTNREGCSATDSVWVEGWIDDHGSVAPVALPAPRVFPNPASHQLSIEFAQAPNPNTELMLLNSQGKVVLKTSLQNLEFSQNHRILPLHKIASGTYFLTIKGYKTQTVLISQD